MEWSKEKTVELINYNIIIITGIIIVIIIIIIIIITIIIIILSFVLKPHALTIYFFFSFNVLYKTTVAAIETRPSSSVFIFLIFCNKCNTKL